jgi:hypothetical protein
MASSASAVHPDEVRAILLALQSTQHVLSLPEYGPEAVVEGRTRAAALGAQPCCGEHREHGLQSPRRRRYRRRRRDNSSSSSSSGSGGSGGSSSCCCYCCCGCSGGGDASAACAFRPWSLVAAALARRVLVAAVLQPALPMLAAGRSALAALAALARRCVDRR